MYNQGNYNTQFGQGLQTPLPPFQQLPLAQALPPPPPPQFQHGPPPHSVNQQVHPPFPSHGGQLGPFPYRYGPSPPSTFPRAPSSGMPNAGQSFLHYPPPVHGSTPLAHVFLTTQQNSPRPSPFVKQNVYPVQPPAPPAHGPPPPRVLPPSSQGQTSYRAPVHQSPQQHNGMQGSQQIPLPPPPPPPSASNFSTPAPFGSSIHSTGGNSHMTVEGLPPQPPPPSSPPPLPPPPPPLASPFLSPIPLPAIPNLPCISDHNPDSDKLSGCGLRTSSSTDEKSASGDGRDKLPEQDIYLNLKVVSGSQEGFLAGNGLSLKRNMILAPPPPKPREENIVQRIEAFCQSIAKNGSDYEDMALQNESGNSEFEFLLGGEPGSEADIAHEYFLWMKKKCMLDK